MRISFVVISLVLFSFVLSAQSEVELYSKREGNVVTIYANNPAVIPMTVDLKLELENMKTDFGGNTGQFVIPEKSNGFIVASAAGANRSGRTGLKLESYIYTGDISKTPDKEFIYDLPFESGSSFQVSQGYNGRFSHQGENAIDFSLEIGDKVFAARGGIVYKVVDEHSKSCRRSSCQQFNNFITVYHEDGTFSEYSHLNKNGAKVKVGEKIEKGDFIGYSGNTGWSSGPHLHFVVYRNTKNGERETIKTKFATKNNASASLKENNIYTKL